MTVDLLKWRKAEGGGRKAQQIIPAALILLAGSVVLIGCPRAQSPSAGPSQQQAFHQAREGESLLKAAAHQLNDLPSIVDTELRKPQVILDASKSTDNKDVLAVVLRNPSAPDAPINVVSIPANNALFRRAGVKSGDVLKYYVLEDETVDDDSRQVGFTKRVAMELFVAQVVDDQTLLIEGSLSTEVTNPERIEIWRYIDERQKEITRQLSTYYERRLPALSWEPSPDAAALAQIVVWLNQWLRQSEPKTDWKPDPLLEKLQPDLAGDEQLKPFISKESLGRTVFDPREGRLLQEAVWHRDIGRWARGESFDDLERAAALFDWTVRNVQLEPDENAAPHRPWQVLLFGRGTVEQRAWVFALLCRQLGLDVVMLTQPDGDGTKLWLPALVQTDQLYLFDARLGLPVPGPGGKGIATLAQVQADDAVLRQLDLPDAPYPMTAESAKKVAVQIVADPFDLTRRASIVEEKLSGDDRVMLAVDASALAERLKASLHTDGVRLWNYPFELLRTQLTLGKQARFAEVLKFEPLVVRPMLWKARMRHFQGRRQVVDPAKKTAGEEIVDDHREAAQLYTDPSVRPTDRAIEQSGSTDQQRVDTSAKLDATYWIGLMLYDDGNFPVAVHWFSRPELQAPGSRWVAGSRYNLARAYESQGKVDEAIDLLQSDASPQQHGNKLRAKELGQKAESKPSAEQGKE